MARVLAAGLGAALLLAGTVAAQPDDERGQAHNRAGQPVLPDHPQGPANGRAGQAPRPEGGPPAGGRAPVGPAPGPGAGQPRPPGGGERPPGRPDRPGEPGLGRPTGPRPGDDRSGPRDDRRGDGYRQQGPGPRPGDDGPGPRNDRRGDGYRPQGPGQDFRPPRDGRPPAGGPRFGDRFNWDGRGWRTDRQFRGWDYRYPRGWGYQTWYFGEILPPIFFEQDYTIRDFWRYDLPEPPPGYRWIRVGPDALLARYGDGYILDVVYGLFY